MEPAPLPPILLNSAVSLDESQPPALPASARLKRDLAKTHAALEDVMQLPHAIQTVADYAATLKIFHAVFAPLEDALAQQRQWPLHGIDFATHRRAPALAADLKTLTGETAPATQKIPPFARFAEAFGALYVLEGSALGGRFILRDLERRLGPAIAGAKTFFEGNGAQTGPFWQDFRQKLDAYGARRPDQFQHLAAGAAKTFGRFMQAAKHRAA